MKDQNSNMLERLTKAERPVYSSMIEAGFIDIGRMQFNTYSKKTLVSLIVWHADRVEISILAKETRLSMPYNGEINNLGSFVNGLIKAMNLEA